MNITQELQSRLHAALTELVDDPTPYAGMIKPVADPQFGDFQANCAMPLKAKLQQPPREIAERIVAALDVADLCESPEIAGPGFINLRLRDGWITSQINDVFDDPRLGVAQSEEPKTVVIDFSSPNVAKPMHVGHLRSTVIGDALQRVLRFLGHTVISDNHVGDWGTQFGMIIYGYKHFRDDDAYRQAPVAELARLYRLVNTLQDFQAANNELPKLTEQLATQQAQLQSQETSAGTDKSAKKALKKLRSDMARSQGELAKLQQTIDAVQADETLTRLSASHPDIGRRARDETAKLHRGDEENHRLWAEHLPHCLAALQTVYDRLDIHFDETLGESHYQPLLADVVESLQSKGLASESDGAMCVFIEGNDAPFIVQKADGAYTYATTDLATIRHRIENEHADTIVYVVDSRQAEHFHLLFETARAWGDDDVDLEYIKFGTVMGQDGKPFKTRSGSNVGLESLLDEAIAEARKVIDENDEAKPNGPELSDAERERIAEIVGLGGIKYADLSHNRESDYVFDWEKMLAKNGHTATYMQYAYARTRGILRRGEVDDETVRQSAVPIVLTHPAERDLALRLCRFGEAVEQVVVEYRPNVITQYLFETANAFSTFFEACPVVKAEDDAVRMSRYQLVELTGRVIAQGLSLLGIEVVEQM